MYSNNLYLVNCDDFCDMFMHISFFYTNAMAYFSIKKLKSNVFVIHAYWDLIVQNLNFFSCFYTVKPSILCLCLVSMYLWKKYIRLYLCLPTSPLGLFFLVVAKKFGFFRGGNIYLFLCSLFYIVCGFFFIKMFPFSVYN